MDPILDRMDQFGPERVICVSDPRTGMKGVLVIDNTARGPGKGGCRISLSVTVAEMARLARVMTWKWAIIDLFFGGAQAGIVADPASTRKEDIIRSFVRAVREYVPGKFVFGLDMGLVEKDAAIILDEMDDRLAVVGTPAELGGVPYDELGVAGYGLAEATEVAAQFHGIELKGATAAIQGFGAVGHAAAKYLAAKGVTIVAVSTLEGAVYDPTGLDVAQLLALREQVGDRLVKALPGSRHIPLGDELTLPVDILVPAATQDVITFQNVDRVKAGILVEGANMPTRPECERVLSNRGVTIVPDIIANAGGVIAVGMAMDARYSCLRPDPGETYALISDKMRTNVASVLERVQAERKPPRQIAMEMAKNRVLRAMQLRGRLND